MNVLYEYVSTYYIKNILKKRKNEAELPHFVVGLCGYAPLLHAMLRHVIGLHESPASSSCSMSGVMYWVWFEVEGEVGEVHRHGFYPSFLCSPRLCSCDNRWLHYTWSEFLGTGIRRLLCSTLGGAVPVAALRVIALESVALTALRRGIPRGGVGLLSPLSSLLSVATVASSSACRCSLCPCRVPFIVVCFPTPALHPRVVM